MNLQRRRDISRLVSWSALVAVLVIANYIDRAGGNRPPADVLYRYSTAVAGAFQYLIMLVLVLLIARGPQARQLLGLTRPSSWSKALLLAVAVVVAAYLAEAALTTFVDVGREQGLTPRSWQPARAGGFAANAAVVGLLGPIVEELLFRGLGFGLLRPLGQMLTLTVIGIAFGLRTVSSPGCRC